MSWKPRMGWSPLAVEVGRPQAEQVAALLQGLDIPALVLADDGGGLLAGLPIGAGAAVFVPAALLEQARAALAHSLETDGEGEADAGEPGGGEVWVPAAADLARRALAKWLAARLEREGIPARVRPGSAWTLLVRAADLDRARHHVEEGLARDAAQAEAGLPLTRVVVDGRERFFLALDADAPPPWRDEPDDLDGDRSAPGKDASC